MVPFSEVKKRCAVNLPSSVVCWVSDEGASDGLDVADITVDAVRQGKKSRTGTVELDG